MVLPDIYYGKLQGVARQKAFSIAGITSLDQIQAVKDSLDENVAKGGSFNQWQKEQAVIDLGLPKHRLDNIYRTNLQTSYMAGKWEQFNNPNSKLRYLMYDAINDSRVRPAHLALDGIIRAKSDPFWATHSPPCGFRCRCSLISLSDKQARDRSVNGKGLNQQPVMKLKDGTVVPANPDKGWDYDKTNRMAGVEKAIADKSAKLSPTLKSAYDEKMLKAWNTNIAKKIPVNDLTGLHDLLTDYAKVYPDHLPHGVKGVFAAKETDDFFMATDSKGVFWIADIESSRGFSPAKDLLSGLAAIRNGDLLVVHQEYAIETLWHEMWHNRQVGNEKVMLLDEFAETRLLMETVNQYVSRLSYGGFIENLGGKAVHQDWVMRNGYGYKIKVRRLNAIFDKLKIRETIKGDLFNINANQDLIGIIELLAIAISRKTKIDSRQLEDLLISMVVDDDGDFLPLFNELTSPN